MPELSAAARELSDAERDRLASKHLDGRLWRVVYLQGFGWPLCERRELTKRTYKSPQDAARMLVEIARLPTHHKLIGVWTTRCSWSIVDELPAPLTNDNPEERHDSPTDTNEAARV